MGIGIQNAWAGLMLIPVCWLTVPFGHLPTPGYHSVVALIYLILLGTIATTPCYFYVLKRLPVPVTSTFSYVNPLVGILFGCLLLHETVRLSMMLGVGIILAGVFCVQSSQWVKAIGKPAAFFKEDPVCLPPQARASETC